ncbi:GAS2 domain protein [Aspergillus undulatus]|uniref:GAS2 domain protein n=1 Tax=Aspergillus undulatus TaxID=1810928 RepID=UPI003CCE124A
MASRVSPPRRPFQAPPTLAPKSSNHLAVPKYHVVDPLLGNLSPESTLQALSSTDAIPKNEQAAHDILSKSILQASPTERALGIRAAIAAQKLGQWYREVHAWTWPKRTEAQLGKGFIPPSDAERSIYYGSLPATVIEEYEKRIEEIRDGMDSLDVEELKEHVLNAHIPGRSRPSSANSTMSVPPPLSYVQLSDFTAVITATILRALPLLSRLNALLSAWDVRLLVVRQIPGLLHSLRSVRSELNCALDLLKSTTPPTEKDVLYSFANYHAKRAALESTVVSAGRRMDRILDSLDGREDSLPEDWIDDLESAEADFASWVMQAEKRTVENEWRRLSARSNDDKSKPETALKEMSENRDPEESPAGTNVEPLSPSMDSLDSADTDNEPEIIPISHARLAPLQIGRTPPMETIVEEMGSPFSRPPSQTAGSIASPSVTETKTAPYSPSPLPSNFGDSREVLDTILSMQLDAVSEIPVVANTIRQDIAENVHAHTEKSTQASPVEMPVQPNQFDGNLDVNEDASQSSVGVSPIAESLPLPKKANDKLPAVTSIEPEMSPDKLSIDIKQEKNTAQQPVDVLPVQQYSRLSNEPSAELASTLEGEVVTESDIPRRDIKLENKPVDDSRAEEPLKPTEISLTERLADADSETPAISYSEDMSRPAPTFNEEDSLEELRTPGQPIPSTDTSSADPVRAEAMTNMAESAQLLPNEPCPQEQAPRSKETHPTQLPTLSQDFPAVDALSENNAAISTGNSVSEASENLEPIALDDKAKTSPHDQSSDVSSAERVGEERASPTKNDNYRQLEPAEVEPTTHETAVIESAPPETYSPKVHERCATPPQDNVASLLNLFVPHDSSKKSTERQPSEEPEQDEKNASKKPLDSPIKLSKIRPGLLDLDKHKQKLRVRRTSNASDGSLSDYPSLVSSPEMPEPRTSSSNGTPLLLETPPHFAKDYRLSKLTRQNNDHTLREDRLVHLDAQKPSPRDPFTHNRALSLPLQRFINESLDESFDTEPANEDDIFGPRSSGKKKSPAKRRLKSRSTNSTSTMRRSDVQHLAPTREASSGPDSDISSDAQPEAHKRIGKSSIKNPRKDSTPVEPPSNITTARLKKQLTAHLSLESIGPYKSNALPRNFSSTSLGKPRSRASSVSRPPTRPKDQMDEKINSILTSLPGHIHLVPADHDDDAISVTSSVPFRRERLRSDSPQGTPTRSFTPAPSLTLRPAMTRRRQSHAPEESSVKLYHLHRGGKSAPTKLFVRTVGENGERVMVRVGGGWADLAEYLREYAIHHGRRHVSETPRVEVEGLPSRDSPSYSPPSSRVPSGSGRPIPARPRSVLSNRPSSSLAVRKTRRSSNVSDMGDLRRPSAASDALNVSFSPTSTNFPGRRLSVSSNVSAGAMSSVSEARHGSPGAPAMPLGLAGPKPRAKHSHISPESEAWVEDVLGQARRSSSLRPLKYTLPSPENDAEGNPTPTLPKSRSISDIGKAGSSKRVVLRGLR